MRSAKRLIVACAVLGLVACANDDYGDLDQFMAEKRARPAGIIAPIPAFKDYEAFAYSATTTRSPFERPVAVQEVAQLQSVATVRPDPNRPKEFLEQYTLESLQMVGSIRRDNKDWTLIQDPEGGIHRVGVGNYMGRNHGRVVDMSATYVAVVEIVSDGSDDGWVERPRSIALKGLNMGEG